ncbi:MAG: TRAP transporter small permease [Alphaproteobacteria bacterium]|nr:TRAP transporter small permease [Alphaproteobacteria bacterium]
MAEESAEGSRIGRVLELGSTALALAGGLVLTGIMLMSIASIAGRWLLSRPVPGDFELVEIGSGLAIFLFLPACQLRGANVIVDFFTASLSRRARAWLDGLGALLYTLVAALFAWRLVFGGLDYVSYGERTMVLGLPLWVSFVLIVPATIWLALVAAYTTSRHVRAAAR